MYTHRRLDQQYSPVVVSDCLHNSEVLESLHYTSRLLKNQTAAALCFASLPVFSLVKKTSHVEGAALSKLQLDRSEQGALGNRHHVGDVRGYTRSLKKTIFCILRPVGKHHKNSVFFGLTGEKNREKELLHGSH